MVFIISVLLASGVLLLWRYARRKVCVEHETAFQTPMRTGPDIIVAFGVGTWSGHAGDPSQGSGQWFVETKKLVLLR
ncbi:MAG: hypothetical protein ACE5H0_11215 [Bacteroidota bacterium]